MSLSYGSGPQDEQIEVTLFGPGYGEAIAIHLGYGRWMLVDSCIEPGEKKASTEAYLDSIGVAPSQVKLIVASHWHDDHVRGLSSLIRKYRQAEFFMPGVFSNSESAGFLAAYSGAESSGLSRGTKELVCAIQDCAQPVVTKERTLVYQSNDHGVPISVLAYSPTEAGFSDFLQKILRYVPRDGANMPIGHAPDLSPNFTSIVLHIQISDEAMLLGADLEDHHKCGWEWVWNQQWHGSRPRAGYFKIAHHGSKTGENSRTWRQALTESPLAVMSPFVRGSQVLPTAEDKHRIHARTDRAFITSVSSRKPKLPTDQLKRLQDICESVNVSQSGFGAVRSRRQLGTTSWDVELFGSAAPLR